MRKAVIIILSITCLALIGISLPTYAACNPACQDPLVCCSRANSSSCTTQAQCDGAWWDTPQAWDEAFCTDNWWTFYNGECYAAWSEDLFCIKNGGTYANWECVVWNEQADNKACMAKCKTTQWNSESFCSCKCNGWIVLNTEFPFIGRCIAKTSDDTVGKVAGVFTNILMTIIITSAFGMLIRAGVQFTMDKPKEAKQTIMNVVIAFAALWSLGILLRLINPNFFK